MGRWRGGAGVLEVGGREGGKGSGVGGGAWGGGVSVGHFGMACVVKLVCLYLAGFGG